MNNWNIKINYITNKYINKDPLSIIPTMTKEDILNTFDSFKDKLAEEGDSI